MWCSLSIWIGDTESFCDSGYLTCFASSGSTWHYSLRVLGVHPMSGDVRQLGVELRFGLELPPPFLDPYSTPPVPCYDEILSTSHESSSSSLDILHVLLGW